MTNLRSSEPTDINVYFVRSFTIGATTPPRIAETISSDCFVGVTDDATESGIILSNDKLNEFVDDTVRTVGHEIGHMLIDRAFWTSGGNEHFTKLGGALPARNMMTVPAQRVRWAFNDPDQCVNINMDTTIFRGDP